MLKIRLQRRGKKRQAHFRVVLQEHTSKLQGKYLELLGSYDPHAKKLEVNRERVEYWMSQGAQISPTVNNLMVNHNVWNRPKMESWRPKKKEKAEEEAGPAKAEPAEEKEEGTEEPSAEAVPTEEQKEEEKPAEETTTDTAPAPAA